MINSSCVAHIIILCSSIRTYAYISHVITSCIISTIYYFMTKIIARKTIAMNDILASVCERYSWWNNSSKLILVGRIIFLLVINSFPTTSFIVYGAFENIGITFSFFFIFLFLWLCDLSACISVGGLLFFFVAKTCLDEW
jgi:hypothetical protein